MAGLPEPLAVWDCSDPGSLWWADGCHRERREWAKANIGRVNDTVRGEFYLLDLPFVVLHRFAVDDRGAVLVDAATHEVAMEDPVVQVLDALPPAHLLGRSG